MPPGGAHENMRAWDPEEDDIIMPGALHAKARSSETQQRVRGDGGPRNPGRDVHVLAIIGRLAINNLSVEAAIKCHSALLFTRARRRG